ncbi:MAG: NepR family anti-sigma factor [Hyphomicrobiaceae bacterium]
MADDKPDNRSALKGQERQQAESSAEQTTGQTRKMATDESDRSLNTAAERTPHLSPALQGHLGRQLRAAYSELVHEPMPDKFNQLLEALAATQLKKSARKQEQE